MRILWNNQNSWSSATNYLHWWRGVVWSQNIDISQADISAEWSDDPTQRIVAILQENASLFRKELGKFNDGILMPIPFKERVDMKDLRQTPYSMSPKDRVAMDKILDPLKAIGVVEDVPLGKPSPAAYDTGLQSNIPHCLNTRRASNSAQNLPYRVTETLELKSQKHTFPWLRSYVSRVHGPPRESHYWDPDDQEIEEVQTKSGNIRKEAEKMRRGYKETEKEVAARSL